MTDENEAQTVDVTEKARQVVECLGCCIIEDCHHCRNQKMFPPKCMDKLMEDSRELIKKAYLIKGGKDNE